MAFVLLSSNKFSARESPKVSITFLCYRNSIIRQVVNSSVESRDWMKLLHFFLDKILGGLSRDSGTAASDAL